MVQKKEYEHKSNGGKLFIFIMIAKFILAKINNTDFSFWNVFMISLSAMLIYDILRVGLYCMKIRLILAKISRKFKK